MEENELINDENRNRFELQVGSHTAFIEYKLDGDVISLIHTEVPAALGGKGVGKKLVALVLEYIKQQNLKLIPLCPFVAAYLKRNPEDQQLLVKGYRIK